MHVQVHIRRNQNKKREDRKGGQTQEQDYAYIKSTVTKVSIEFAEKERKPKGGYEYRSEHNTRSARNTGIKTGREESIHTRRRIIETGKQTRNGREGDPGYYWQSAKVVDSHSARQLRVSPAGGFEKNISGTQFYNSFKVE